MKKILFLTEEIWSLSKNSGVSSLHRLILKINNKMRVSIFKPDDYPIDCYFCKNFQLLKLTSKNRYMNYFFNILISIKLNFDYFVAGIQLNEKPDIIYVSSNLPSLSGFLLSRYYKVPYIQRQYGTFLYAKLDNFIEKLKYHREVLSFLLPAEKFIITDDGTYGYDVAKYFKISDDKILFIKNGIDKISEDNKDTYRNLIIRKYNLPSNSFIVISVSRLVSWKRVDRIINAFNTIKDTDVFLIVIGDGEERKFYESIKKNNNILFLGAIKNSEVQKFMLGCDCFVSMYDISNLGNPLLEAMAAGKPIITLNNGNTKSVFNGKNMILLPYENENKIVKSIKENVLLLKNNKVFSEKLSQESKKYADENLMSWNERIDFEINQILLLCGESDEK